MSSLFEAKQVNISTILNSSDCIYQIPSYQRDYQWESENIERFYNDIKKSEEQKHDYFIGSLVLSKQTNGQQKVIDVIDGQQRLTTIFLFLKAFRDIYKNEINVETHITSIIDTNLFDLTTSFNLSKSDIKIKIQTRQISKNLPESCSTFADFIKAPHADILKAAKTSVYTKNYLQLYEYLIKLDKTQMASLLNFLLKNVNLIRIDCQNIDDAIKIFDTINSTGIDLSQSDIVKARIMQGKSDKEMQSIDEQWEIMEEIASKIFIGPKPMDSILGAFLLSKYGIYDGSLKNRFESKQKDFTIEQLTKFASTIDDIQNEGCRYIETLKMTKWENAWIPIIAVQKTLLIPNKYNIFKKDLVRFVYSYYLAGRRSDSIIPMIAKMIIDKSTSFEVEITDTHIKSAKILLESTDIYSGSLKKKCTSAMYLLETFYTDSTTTVQRANLSLDHLLPKSKNTEIRDVDSIGNLCLMSPSKNSQFGNKESLSDKKMSYNNCGLRYAAQSFVDTFTEKDIKNRQSNIVKDVINILKKGKIDNAN